MAPLYLLLALTLLLSLEASADDRCDAFFPDFHCEDRQARYEGFVTPTSMPYLFEDPFITTEVSTHVVWHDFPWDSALRGGEAWLLAVAARLAITDRLAFIATKDGYTWLRPGSHSQISAEQGFFDIAAGFKYALIERPEHGFILTPALRVDLPTGEKDLFSGNGDGVLIPSVSSGLALGPVRLIGSTGWRLPFSPSKESTSLFYNLHVSAPVHDRLVPFLELNGTTWTRSGDGERNVKTKAFGSVDLEIAQDVVHDALGHTEHRRFEGADLVNLGSQGVAGNTLLTLAIGARVPLTKRISLGAYYELPLTQRKDLFEQRAGVNVAYTF